MKNIFSHNNADVSAVILCAGGSTRFSTTKESKQLVEVLGKSVIERTIDAFEVCPSIREIILVVRKEDTSEYNRLICERNFKKISCIVVGGETRQISAMRGFKHISDESTIVAFHDGARCLITPDIIELVIKTARTNKAAAAATHMSDTVKVADENGIVIKTIDRDLIWTVQTPQVFEVQLYQECIANAINNGIVATDDCMLAESYGQKVQLVETGKENIKITYKEDIEIAEAILTLRGEEIEE